MTRDILKNAFKGARFTELKVVDSHCHMGPWYNYYFPRAEIGDMIYDSDILGIDKLCIAPHASISCNYRLGNMLVAKAAEEYPEKVFALLTLNANKPDEIQGEFDKFYSSRYFVGVKLHPALHGYSITDKNCRIVFEKVREYGGYILCHTWDRTEGCNLELCETVIKEYPEIPFVMGHAGGLGSGVEKAIRLANTYENAYLDTSGFEFSNIWIEEIVRLTDNTKILFGSDYPFHDLRGGISRILFADIDDYIKKRILSENYYDMTAKLPKKFNK